MSSPIVDPDIPYNGEIPGGLQPGKMLRLQGVTHPDADRFNVNFQTGPTAKPRDDTALHLSVRLNQGYIARNTYRSGSWEDEQGDGRLPIGKSQAWEILFLVDEQDYKIAINGQHFCEFPHRIPFSDVTHLLIDGDVSITLISWESIVGVGGNESSSKASTLNAEGPQVPQGPPPNFGPQGGYAPPVGNYGPPGGYGPPPGNYGYGVPPPPGAQPESGFDSFLDQAQNVLAGAIKSGAAEKLLGSFFSGGNTQQQQGFNHQNAKYGIYPDLPEDLDLNKKTNQVKQQSGPVESLLSSLFSGGNKQQQMPQNVVDPSQQPRQNQQPLDFSSLLSGLLNPSQQTQPQNQPLNQGNRFSVQQNKPVEQQNQNVDWGAVLGGLISQVSQQNPNASSGKIPVETGANSQFNVPKNVTEEQKNQTVDWEGLLSGLISGGNQQASHGARTDQVPPNPQSIPNLSQQSKGIDMKHLLEGLVSVAAAQTATRPIQETGKSQGPNQNVPYSQGSTQQGQGLDFGQLLTGILSNVAQPQPQGQNVPSGPYGQPSGMKAPTIPPQGQNTPGTQQSQGFDLSSLLSNLISPGQPNSNSPTTYGSSNPNLPIQDSRPPYNPSTIPSNQPDNRQATGPQFPQKPNQPAQPTKSQDSTDIKRQNSKPASQDPIEDVSDELAKVIAAENNSSPGSNQQYGHYPQPQTTQQQGPVEGLLSSFLGGQTHHQQQPQFGGGDSLGGLGSMSGLLQNFAGQILQPRDPNQRQHY